MKSNRTESEVKTIYKIALIGTIEAKAEFIRNAKLITNQNTRETYKGMIGADFQIVNYQNKKFNLWDISAQPRFFNMNKTYLKDVDAVIYLNPSDELRNLTQDHIKDQKNVTIIDDINLKSTPSKCFDLVLQPKVEPKPQYKVKQEKGDRVNSAVTFQRNL